MLIAKYSKHESFPTDNSCKAYQHRPESASMINYFPTNSISFTCQRKIPLIASAIDLLIRLHFSAHARRTRICMCKSLHVTFVFIKVHQSKIIELSESAVSVPISIQSFHAGAEEFFSWKIKVLRVHNLGCKLGKIREKSNFPCAAIEIYGHRSLLGICTLKENFISRSVNLL